MTGWEPSDRSPAPAASGSGSGSRRFRVLRVGTTTLSDWPAGDGATGHGFDVVGPEKAAAAVERVDGRGFDCVVSEYDLPDGNGVALLEAVRELDPDLPFVLVARSGSEAVASRAISAGVTDYLRAGADGSDDERARESESGRGAEHGAGDRERDGSDTPAGLDERLSERVVEHAGSHHEEPYLDRMTDGFFAVNRDWEITYCNDAGFEILREAAGGDLDVEDVVGRNLWEAVPEAVDTPFYDRYREAMATQEPVDFEEYYEPLDTWFSVRAYPSPTGLSVYARDATTERERREELRDRELVLRSVYEVIADQDRSFEWKVDQLVGIGRSVLETDYGALSRVEGEDYVFEAVQSPDGSVEPGDVVPLSATNCERTVATERTLVLGDVAGDAPDLADRAGFTEWGIECYLGAPVFVDDEVYGTFCFYDEDVREDGFSEWEVTLVDLLSRWISYELERREHERRLLAQNERLEEFASTVSHDLRNPLEVAEGVVEIARKTGDVTPERLAELDDALCRMERVVDDVLSLARTGGESLETGPVSLATVAKEAWSMVEANDVEFVVADGATGAGGTIVADGSQLQQLLENLLGNSVEHSSTGNRTGSGNSVEHSSTGNRTKSGDSVEQGSTTGDGDVTTVEIGRIDGGFYVADDGPGIPEEERDEVFEAGYSTAVDGTGYGLSIVQGIASAHGWSVHVVESDGGGTRVEFTGVAEP